MAAKKLLNEDALVAVKNYVDDSINAAISTTYKVKGSATPSDLNSHTPAWIPDDNGNVYNITQAGTLINSDSSTVDVVVGDNVVLLVTGSSSPYTYKWDKLAGEWDLSIFVPYTSASSNVDLGSHVLTASAINLTSSLYEISTLSSDLQIITGTGNIILNPDGKLYYGSSVSGNEVATHSWISSSFIPYSGATSNINFNSRTVTFSNVSGGTTYGIDINTNQPNITVEAHPGASISWGGAATLGVAIPSSGPLVLPIYEGYVYVYRGISSHFSAAYYKCDNIQQVVETGDRGTATIHYTFTPTDGTFNLSDGDVVNETFATRQWVSNKFVPYSGASSNVDLGSYTLAFSSFNSIYSASVSTTISPYGLSIYTIGDGVKVDGPDAVIRLYNGSSVYAEFGHDDGGAVEIHYSSINGSFYTYQFPNSTGTIALIEQVLTLAECSQILSTGSTITPDA